MTSLVFLLVSFRTPRFLCCYMTSCGCPTVLAGRGTSVTAAVTCAPLTSLSSNRKQCAWSSLSTSGICLPPRRLPLSLADTHLREAQWDLPFSRLLHLLLDHTLRIRPLSPHPRAPVRPQRRAPATVQPAVHLWGKLPQMHKDQGTGWGPSPVH